MAGMFWYHSNRGEAIRSRTLVKACRGALAVARHNGQNPNAIDAVHVFQGPEAKAVHAATAWGREGRVSFVNGYAV